MIKVIFLKLVVRKVFFYGLGFVLLLVSVVGIDLASYEQLTRQDLIYRVTIQELAEKRFDLRLQSEGYDKTFDLEGDQWRIDFRLIRFSAGMTIAGFSNLYQPSRLSNRYESIEDEQAKPKQFYSLRESIVEAVDLWQFIKTYFTYVPGVESAFGSSVYAPLKNNAEYEIFIGYAGVVVKAANQAGRSAIQQWL